MPGTIIIRPIQAKLEINDGLIKKLDPYCIAVIGNTMARSSVCKKGGKAPQWQDSLILSHADEPFCFLQVKDSNILKDRKLGSCTIDIEDTLNSVFSQRWYELYDHERPVGEILIEAKAGRDYNRNDDIPVEHIVAQKSDRLLKKWRDQESQRRAQRQDSAAEPDIVRNLAKELVFHSAESGNSGGSKEDQEIAKENHEENLLGSPPQQEISHEIKPTNDLHKRNKAQELADNIREMDESINLVTEIRERPVIPDSITVNASHRKFSNEFTPKKATFVRISQKGPGSLKKNAISPKTTTINLNSTDLASPSPQIIPVHSYQSPQITSKTQSRHNFKQRFLTDIKAAKEEFPRKKLFHHTDKKPFRALILDSNKKKNPSFGNFLPVARTPDQKKLQESQNKRPPLKPVFNWDEEQLQNGDYLLPSISYKMRKNEQKMRKSEETKVLKSSFQGSYSSPRKIIPKIDVKKRKQNEEKKVLPSQAYYLQKSENIEILRAMIPKVDVQKKDLDHEDKENVQNEANKGYIGPKYFGSPAQEKIHDTLEHLKEAFNERSSRLKKDLDFEMRRLSYKKERYNKEQKILAERKQVEALHEGEKMKEGLRSLNFTPGKENSGFTSPKSEKRLKKIAYRTYVECYGDDDEEGNHEENLWDL